jgi:CheY-like chemotaxis protein/anti-sigma regulatory factor (Ser/Thr protein kinase)
VPTVLVVDDSAVDRRLAAGLIEQLEGWQVLSVGDGGAALATVVRQPVDIVVTDLQMPNFSGLDLVKELRRQFPQIAVVLMTAQGSEEIAVKALQAGAASYVPKRALATTLAPTLRRVLSAASEERSQQSLLSRLGRRTESYTLATDLGLLTALSRSLQQTVGEAWGLDKTERLRIGTAIEEALLNAYYHGSLEVQSDLKDEDYSRFNALADERALQSPYRDRTISVKADLTLQTVSITIRDEGPGFDPRTLPEPSSAENLDRLCGRGVMLMRAFMSEVHFNETGNEVTLVKHRFQQ